MNIYCTPRFKAEFDKLYSKKSYKNIEQLMIDYFFNKDQNLLSGTNLNRSNIVPFIKKRIEGRGGFRFYFIILIKEDSLYLSYVHPKSGSLGIDNINNEFKAKIQKEVFECIKSNDLLIVTQNEKKKLDFSEPFPGTYIIEDESKIS